jgi:predicted nuclease of predicted toxin-antitoxin system
MRLLLDEHISPALVARLAEVGIYAQSVPHVGLAGRWDHEIWQYALERFCSCYNKCARLHRTPPYIQG